MRFPSRYSVHRIIEALQIYTDIRSPHLHFHEDLDRQSGELYLHVKRTTEVAILDVNANFAANCQDASLMASPPSLRSG